MKKLVVFTFPYQINENHATELSTIGYVISEWLSKIIFDFTEIVSNYWLVRGTVCQTVRFIFRVSFETVHTILKSTFLSTVFRSICKDNCKKNCVLEISTKIFWLDCLSTFNSSQKLRNSGSALLFIVFRCYLSFQFY